MGRVDRPLGGYPGGAWVGLLAVAILVSLPLLAASAFSAPAAQILQPVGYLPLVSAPAYYRLAFDRDGSVYTMKVNGSNQTFLAVGSNPAWSPDGRRIAFEQNWGTYVMNADGSNQIGLPGGRTPVWSPDGRRIATGGGDISVMSADGSNVIAITKSKYGQNMSPAWSPDGVWIAFVYGDELYRYGYDICLKRSNGFTTMWDLSRSLSDGDEYSPAWSPDGRWLAFSSSYPFYENSIYIVHPDGTNLTRLTAGGGPPAWSPDGQRLAFEQNGEIYAINIDGSNRINLTNNPADDTNPAWSPDGRRIAFVSKRDGNPEIYVMNADGTNPTNLSNDPSSADTNPVWSPVVY